MLPGSVLGLLRQGLAAVGEHPVEGPIIDIGCAVGRTSFELAEAFDELVLGVDMSFGMLKTAMGVLARGRVSYPRRRVGIVYDRREFPAAFESSPNVDFWVCDATCLPFSDSSFALAAGLNVLDCLASPHKHLKELARVLRPGSKAIITTPYDWNVAATPVESWLGGHSQRSKDQGSSESMLRSLLSGGGHRDAIEELELLDETADIPWGLRLHERSCMKYLVHMLLVGKTDA